MYSVRKATVADREAISNIWRSSFTEDQDYIDTYLDLCFPYCKGYFLLTDNDGIVSCLSVIPSYISRGSETITGGYIYAVATLPEHRGNGFAAVLIEEVTRICKNSGYSYLIVKPATAELSPYYERLGFNIKLKAALTIIARNNFYLSEKTGYTVTPMTGKVLHKLRVRTLSGYYFLTIPKIVHYAVSECLNRGGVSVVLEKESIVPSSPV
ncbi:MAG: GNAT family N-acetyltransferase, partial [Bacteroidales bacterium]|nr:GNAT family N-acetyltransferase [Bacteroidales bacterium]